MDLCIWTKEPANKVISSLSSVLLKDIETRVVSNTNKIPDAPVVLALGTETVATLAAANKITKNRTIASLRTQVHEVGIQRFLVSYSPIIYEVDYGHYIDLLCDARLASRLAATGSYEPVLGFYEYVSDFSKLIAEIEEMYAVTGKAVEVCHDTETIGLDPFAKATETHPGARFVTWQWSHRPGYSAVRYFTSKEDFDTALDAGLYDQAKWLLTTDKVSHRLANGKFDLNWHFVHTRGLECTNFKFDSTLVGSTLDENRSNALDVHAKIYTNLGGYSDNFDRTIDKSRMDLVPKEQLLHYAGGDTDAGLQVASAMKVALTKQPALANFYVNCLHPAARAFEVIERGGVYIDTEAYKNFESELMLELRTLVDKALPILGGRIYAKHRNDKHIMGINLTKASLLTDFLFSPMGLDLTPIEKTAKSGKPSTAMAHLLKFKDHPDAGPFVKLLDEFSSISKMLSTYVIGFKEHIRSDGRFHPSYFLHKGNKDEDEGGTVTGRLSARDPAFQTIPKHSKWAKRLREVFSAPPGFLVLERDYSQGELKIVACLANEEAMLEAYKQGKDLHVKTGAGLAGYTYDEVIAMQETSPDKYDAIRTPAKPANFGLLYGQEAEGFRDYAENNYGVKFTLDQARVIRTKFFEMYPKLIQYHDDCKEYAHQHGGIPSPLGRIRHLPLIKSPHWGTRSKVERQAINSPVQSCLSDMMIMALGIEWQQGVFKYAPCFGVVHDAAYSYIPEDRSVEVATTLRDIMENLPLDKFGWRPQLKFTADVKVGKNMAKLSKVKFKT